MTAETLCTSCALVQSYVDLSDRFARAVGEALSAPMWSLFIAITAFWIVFQGIKLMAGLTDVAGAAKEFFFMLIAASLLKVQGSFIAGVYAAIYKVMGSGAAVALSLGGVSEAAGSDGMIRLVATAETGLRHVLDMGGQLIENMSITDPSGLLYGVVLMLPYALLFVVFTAQVVVSIFRIMMLATFSPFLLLSVGFSWGRGMTVAGIRTAIAAFLVLFAATASVGLCLYGIGDLEVAAKGTNLEDFASFTNSTFLTTVLMGWVGTALLTEATGLANSIAQSSLTNAAAATMTAGAVTTALAALAKGKGAAKGAGFLAGRPAGKAAGAAVGKSETLSKGRDTLNRYLDVMGYKKGDGP